MKQRKYSISQKSRRDSRNVMRACFEKNERSLYPDDESRLKRCKVTGDYLKETVQIGYTDWKSAWHSAVRHERSSTKTEQLKTKIE